MKGKASTAWKTVSRLFDEAKEKLRGEEEFSSSEALLYDVMPDVEVWAKKMETITGKMPTDRAKMVKAAEIIRRFREVAKEITT